MYPYYKGKDQGGIDYDDVLAMYELYSKSKIFLLHLLLECPSIFAFPVKYTIPFLFKFSSDISSFATVSTQTEEEYKEWARSRERVAQSQIFYSNAKTKFYPNFTPIKNGKIFYMDIIHEMFGILQL